MTGVLMAQPAWPLGRHWSWPLRRHGQALAFTLALHALLLGGLLLADWPQPAPTAKARTISVQLAHLPPPPAPVVAPMAAISTPVELAQAPAASAEPPAKPRSTRPKPDQAALARQRIARQQLEQQRQQQAQQARQQQELRQQAAEAQRQQQQAAAAEQQQALAAERARQAAAAASRPYLPLTKQPPTYPQRALDKGIEGDCSVSYRVNAEGRVENPVASADCHPLFVRPSLAAARAFRYQPRVIDGRAVAVPHVSNTFEYRIE